MLPFWQIHRGEGPLVACALHHGHKVEKNVAKEFALDRMSRLREEDPFTGSWTQIAPSGIVVYLSRFQVDFNRPREKAIYLTPEEAWGLKVWKDQPSPEVIKRSLSLYDAFYAEVKKLFSSFERLYGRFLVLDLHSYNHRRSGPGRPCADPQMNPEINLGTACLDQGRWGVVLDRLMTDLRSLDFLGRRLDVRENIKFSGGHFVQWIHEQFPTSACAIAIEFKKLFMDEWTGKPDKKHLAAIQQALASVVPGLLAELPKA